MAESCPTDSNVTNCEKIASKGDAIYWKIIRTNYDGSIRLLYTFNVTTLDQTTPVYNSKMIGSAPYNVFKTANDKIHLLTYVGYMYKVGNVLDLDSNENDSTIKLYLEEWYKNIWIITIVNLLVIMQCIVMIDKLLTLATPELHGKDFLNYYLHIIVIG